MRTPDFGYTPPPTETAPALTVLAQRTDLAPKVRSLLHGVNSISAALFTRHVNEAIDNFEQALFTSAERARSNDVQNRFFDSLREVKRRRIDITPRFLAVIEDAIANFDRDLDKKHSVHPAASGGMDEGGKLGLIAHNDLEESLALQEIAAKAEVRQSQPLYALGHRFAVLAAAPLIEADALAIGPARIADAARLSTADLDLPIDHRVMFYRSFDHAVMIELRNLYDALNEYFSQHRILRHLRAQPFRGKGAAPAAPATTVDASAAKRDAKTANGPETAGQDGEPAVAGGDGGAWGGDGGHPGSAHGSSGRFPGPGREPGLEPASPSGPSDGAVQVGPGGQGVSPGWAYDHPADPAGGEHGAASAPRVRAEGMGPSAAHRGGHANAPLGPSNAAAGSSEGGGEADPDSQMFTILRGLLWDRRRTAASGAVNSNAGASPAPAAGTPTISRKDAQYVATADDVQATLNMLQRRPAPPMVVGGRPVPRTIDHLKQDMLGQLRSFSPDGTPPRFAEEDSDTMDLVGMLFDHVGKLAHADSGTQSLMTSLQVPVLRVALKDKTFFSRKAHPARKLLNTIAETGTHWIDHADGEVDRSLVDKMRLMVERVSNDFDGDVGLFEDMLGDLTQHMSMLTRKAEVAERRHVEAAKGREKLELAREQAASAIAHRVEQHKPTKLLRTVLEQGWTDVLALTLLRQGEQSPVYKRRLEVADQLIAAELSARAGNDASKSRGNDELRQEVEAGLDQVGLHRDDVQTVVKKLFTPEDEAQDENPVSQTEVALKLKNKAHVGVDAAEAGAPKPAPGKFQGAPLNAEEERMLERLGKVPFGTWFEFVVNQQGQRVRRKLSWFSPVTRRCLFVNQRGARSVETSMDQLARDLVRGQVLFIEPQSDSLVDRALRAIRDSLQSLVGRGSDGDSALAAQPASGS